VRQIAESIKRFYALHRWHLHRQEAAIPETPFVPELAAA